MVRLQTIKLILYAVAKTLLQVAVGVVFVVLLFIFLLIVGTTNW